MANLESEYDNSARVPEWPQIFENWRRDSASYRKKPGAKLNIPYGFSQRMFYDFFPCGAHNAPLSLFIHGGYWQHMEASSFSHMAAGLNAHGVDVAIANYDLCPNLKLVEIIEQMRELCRHLWESYSKPLFAYGHSAGGHLAACLLATDWHTRNLPARLVQSGMAISGIFDLYPLLFTPINNNLSLSASEAAVVSPIGFPSPIGTNFAAVVGADESQSFHRQSIDIVDRWQRGGVLAKYEIAENENHFTVINPLADSNSSLTQLAASMSFGRFPDAA